MNHLMVDLETLSTDTHAVFLSVGAVVFNPDGDTLGETLHLGCNPDDQIKLGGDVSGGTILWHFQNTASKGVKFPEPLALTVVMKQLAVFYQRHGCRGVWSNGATFDIPILQHWYRVLGGNCPWHYGDALDTRTIFKAAWGWTSDSPTRGNARHDALDDAVNQAVLVQKAIEAVKTMPFGQPKVRRKD